MHLLTASKEPLVKSITPAVGLVTSPTAPLPKPLKKPPTPCSLAPVIGLVNTPVTPSTTPCEITQFQTSVAMIMKKILLYHNETFSSSRKTFLYSRWLFV